MDKWLDWSQRLAAIARNGEEFNENPFDRERYASVREIAAEMMADHSGLDLDRVLDLFTQETGYATPKLDGRGVVFRKDAILLVREKQDGLWTLPGGYLDVGESPSEGIVREVREESGYETRAVKLLALYDRNNHDHPPCPFHLYKVFLLCELIGGAPVESIETDGAEFFEENNIPPLSEPRVTMAQISRMFEHYRHPEWPTDFD